MTKFPLSIHITGAVSNRGFTLLEVLIALVVLAIGVLGVVGLQVSTYQQLHTSHNYGFAAMQASNMADRMLANQAQALANAYNHTGAPGDFKDCANTEVVCSTAEVAAYDIAQWQRLVTGIVDDEKIPGSLPAGTGAVARVNGTNDFTITVRWDDDLSGSSGTDCTDLDPEADQDEDDLDCFVLELRL